MATERRLPLQGLRACDFSRVVAGPYGGYLLARMGAEVIKIEDPGHLDTSRDFGPFSDGQNDFNRAGYFASLNGGKKSVRLSLTDPADATIARQLALSSDIVIENFPSGVMDRLGLGFDALAAVKPGIVMISATGFGHTGPMARHRAYMNTVAAYIGLTSLSGYEGGDEVPVGATFSDFVAGTCVAFAALLAVRRARATGRGQQIDLSMAESSMALMGEPFLSYALRGAPPERRGNAFTGDAPGNAYPTMGNDKWIAISVGTDGQWARLVALMGTPSWATSAAFATRESRFANRRELDRWVGAWTAQFTNVDLSIRLQAEGIPALPSNDPEDLVANPHLRARNAIAIQDFALEPGRAMPNLPWQFESHPELGTAIPAPPIVGEHNGALLPELAIRTRQSLSQSD